MNMLPIANTQSSPLKPRIVHAAIVAGLLSGAVAIVAIAGWLPHSVSSPADAVGSKTGPSENFWPLNALTQQPVLPEGTAICGRCGTVEASLTVVTNSETEALPSSAGSAIGGLIGLQAGGGREVGMLIGALVGKTADKKTQPGARNDVTVRLGDGSMIVIREKHSVLWEPGDRVKVVNGVLRRN